MKLYLCFHFLPCSLFSVTLCSPSFTHIYPHLPSFTPPHLPSFTHIPGPSCCFKVHWQTKHWGLQKKKKKSHHLKWVSQSSARYYVLRRKQLFQDVSLSFSIWFFSDFLLKPSLPFIIFLLCRLLLLFHHKSLPVY